LASGQSQSWSHQHLIPTNSDVDDHALVAMTHECQTVCARSIQGGAVRALLVDFKKAFDSANHKQTLCHLVRKVITLSHRNTHHSGDQQFWGLCRVHKARRHKGKGKGKGSV